MATVDKTSIEHITAEDLGDILNIGVTGDNVITPESTDTPGESSKDSTDVTDVKKEPGSFTAGLNEDPLDFNELLKTAGHDFDEPDVVDVINSKSTSPVKEKEEGKETKPTLDIEKIASDLIEEGLLAGFEDDAPVQTMEDLKELIKGNIEHKKAAELEQEIAAFFGSLPQELRIAAEYALNGGTDMKSLFRTLADVEEVREYSIEDEDGQEAIVREYLKGQNYTKEEIEQELFDLKDTGRLENKAKMYKPKLEKARQEELEEKLEREREAEEQRKKYQVVYRENVLNAVKDGDINGVKIDKKVADQLYKGLAEGSYQSVTGGTTNLLGALLEKIQFIEPNYKLLVEATWLLADPEGYKKKVRAGIKEEVTAETVRKIKTSNQSSKVGSTSTQDFKEENKPKIKRSGFFNKL